MPSPLLRRARRRSIADLAGWLVPLPAVHAGRRRAQQRLDDPGGRLRGPARSPAPDPRGARRPGPGRGRLRLGPPELVVEVGKSSRSYDLGAKKADYERAGVLEYLFVGIEPDEVRWFVRRERPVRGDRRRRRTGSIGPRSSPASGSTRRPSSPRTSTA